MKRTLMALFSLAATLTLSLVPQLVFAGGSSFSWKSTAFSAVVRPSEDVGILSLNVKNYFPNHRNISLDSVEVLCTGTIAGTTLTMNSPSMPYGYRSKVRNYRGAQVVVFTPTALIAGNDSADFLIHVVTPAKATPGQMDHCSISRIQVKDLSKDSSYGTILYKGRGTHDYAFNEGNDIATILVGVDENASW